jgi:hypothetical protein
MTTGPQVSTDPLVRLLFQPAVNALHVEPRGAAATSGNMFLACAVTLTAVRAGTMDWAATPGLAADLAMAMTGAIIMWCVMRFGAVNGPTMLIGPYGAVHLGVRLLFLYCVAADVVQVTVLVAADDGVEGISLFRALLQLAQSVAGLTSLYLALCAPPPPRRPRTMRRHATA